MNMHIEKILLTPELAGKISNLKRTQSVLHQLIQKGENVDFTSKEWDWKVALALAKSSTFLEVREASDSVSGMTFWPNYSGMAHPQGILIRDKGALRSLSEYIDEKISNTETAVRTAYAAKDTYRWRCPECGYCIAYFEKKKMRALIDLLIGVPQPLHCNKCRVASFPFALEGRIKVLPVEVLQKPSD
jgi:hypothetical protein